MDWIQRNIEVCYALGTAGLAEIVSESINKRPKAEGFIITLASYLLGRTIMICSKEMWKRCRGTDPTASRMDQNSRWLINCDRSYLNIENIMGIWLKVSMNSVIGTAVCIGVLESKCLTTTLSSVDVLVQYSINLVSSAILPMAMLCEPFTVPENETSLLPEQVEIDQI